jgi:hemolysin activation/secretion protein
MALNRSIRRTSFAIAAGLTFLSITGSGVAQVPPPGIDSQRRQDEQRQQTEQRASERPSVRAC